MQPTVNIVSYFETQAGIPQYARYLAATLERGGYPVHYRTCRRTWVRDALVPTGAPLGSDVTLWVVNPSELVHEFQPLSGRHVGMWFWEVEGKWPSEVQLAAERLDEVWVSSQYCARIFEGCGKSVHHIPATVPAMPARSRAVGDHTCSILCVCDSTSGIERKNPLGALLTFQKAFRAGEDVRLIVKTRRREHARDFWSDFERRAKDWPVTVLDWHIPDADLHQLIADADIFLSLHRSEGLGLPIAEAMRAGVPVVATGHGGCMDWMTEANSCPVPFEMVTLDRQIGPYPAGARWAEPDIEYAADVLYNLYLDWRVAWSLREGRPAIATLLGGGPTLAALTARIDALLGG